MASLVNKVRTLRQNFGTINGTSNNKRKKINKIIHNLESEIEAGEENGLNNENSILNKIRKKSKQLKLLKNLEKKEEWNWENITYKNSINEILEPQIEELTSKLNLLPPNIRFNKKNFYHNFNNENNENQNHFNIIQKNENRLKLLSEFRNYNIKNYSTLRHSEKIKYRHLFIIILKDLINNIIYDEANIFLEKLNRNIENIFHNKSIYFKRYIHLLIYNDFFRKKKQIDLKYENNPFHESYMRLSLAQKYDLYTNFIEEYLIKIITPVETNSFIYNDTMFNSDYINNSGYELPTPFSDTLDFRNRAYMNQFTGNENENVNQSTQETFLNTLEYIIENYFYEGINIPEKRRNISNHPTVIDNLKDKIRIHMYQYNEEELDTIIAFGKIPFELENYIINIPLPFMINAILSNQGNDVTGLTKQFFTDLTKDINNTVVDENFMVNKSRLTIVKNNKIRENIRIKETTNNARVYINNNGLNENNENRVYRNMRFVPIIQKFLIKKMFEAPNHNKYKFKILKNKHEFNRVAKRMVVKKVESNAIQTRNSNYIPILNNMIIKKDGLLINNYHLQILLFTIVLICCCSISRETRKKIYNPTGQRRSRQVRNFNVKILISKLPDGSLSLGYKIIFAYYLLTLIEEYRSNGNSYMKAEQFNEYLFYLTIFYENKALYNAIQIKDVESLKEIYNTYIKVTEEELNSYSFEFLLNYFKSNYVDRFIKNYTQEIGLNNFNKLLDFYGYHNIYVFMKSHFEGELVTPESIIRNKSIRINNVQDLSTINIRTLHPIYRTYFQGRRVEPINVSNDFYSRIMDKFIISLNKDELKIFSKFITGNLLIQPYYYFNIEIPSEGQNVISIRSATCHNTLYTALIPLIGAKLERFNTNPQVVGKKDTFIDNRFIINYNNNEKALYDFYIFNKDKVIEIMSQGISSYGYA